MKRYSRCRIKKYCARCKKVFYVQQSQRKQKFCSFRCYNPKHHRIFIICRKCKKRFSISATPYNLRHLPLYCSSQCCNRDKHFVSHHIDLNKKHNMKSNKMLLTNVLHGKIHKYSYDYLVENKLIHKYILWFKKKFKKEFDIEGLK